MTLLTRVLSLVMVGLGVAMIVIALDRGDLVRGVLGVLFIAAGLGRMYLQRGRSG